MFAKLSTFLLLALPLASVALTVDTPTGWANGGTGTVTWTASTQDPPSFSIVLVNVAFHNTFAIANNVPTLNGQITVQLPEVPITDGYEIELFANNNINQVFATSGSFAISGPTSDTTTASSTASTSSASAMSSTSSTGTMSVTSMSSMSSMSMSVSMSPSTVASPTGTSTTASSTPTSLNGNGAGSFKLGGVVPAAALVISAVAGAVMVF